jgi:hypothetical protein
VGINAPRRYPIADSIEVIPLETRQRALAWLDRWLRIPAYRAAYLERLRTCLEGAFHKHPQVVSEDDGEDDDEPWPVEESELSIPSSAPSQKWSATKPVVPASAVAGQPMVPRSGDYSSATPGTWPESETELDEKKLVDPPQTHQQAWSPLLSELDPDRILDIITMPITQEVQPLPLIRDLPLVRDLPSAEPGQEPSPGESKPLKPQPPPPASTAALPLSFMDIIDQANVSKSDYA